MRRTFLLLFACAMLTGCSCLRQTVEVPVYIHDTTYTAKEVHDSTYIDRWHTVEVKGDTIFVTNEVTKSKIVTKIDTAYRYIEKPVVTTVTKTVEVAKPLSWWQKALMWSGVAALVVLLAVLLAKFWQLFYR